MRTRAPFLSRATIRPRSCGVARTFKGVPVGSDTAQSSAAAAPAGRAASRSANISSNRRTLAIGFNPFMSDAGYLTHWSYAQSALVQHAIPRLDSAVVSSVRPHVGPPRLPLFCQHVLEHRLSSVKSATAVFSRRFSSPVSLRENSYYPCTPFRGEGQTVFNVERSNPRNFTSKRSGLVSSRNYKIT